MTKVGKAFAIGSLAGAAAILFPWLLGLLYWCRDLWCSDSEAATELDVKLLVIVALLTGLFSGLVARFSRQDNIDDSFLTSLGIPALLFGGITIADLKHENVTLNQEVEKYAQTEEELGLKKESRKSKPVEFKDMNCPQSMGPAQSYVLVLARTYSPQEASKEKEDLEKEIDGLIVCQVGGEYLVIKRGVQTRSKAVLQGIALKKEVKKRDITPQLLRLRAP